MRNYLLAGAAAAVMAASAAAVAQTAPPAHVVAPSIHRAPHAAAVHTRADVGAQVRSLFERLDTNRDGYITRAESEARRAKRGDRDARRIERRRSASPEQRFANRGAMFDRIDANRDGYISRDEFARAPTREERRVVIRNGQGEDRHLREIGTGPMRGMRAMRLAGLGLRGRMFDSTDSNRDGRVSLQEATAAAYRHFDMADANRDGRVTPDERIQMRQRMRAERGRG